MSLSVLHISDLHYVSDPTRCGAFERVLREMTPPLEKLNAACEKLPKRPDFVAISGDLTHGGGQEEYLTLRNALRRLFKDVPLFITPGNHDDPKSLSETFLGKPYDADGCVYTVQEKDIAFVSFDSSAPGEPDGLIRDKVLEKLDRELSALDGATAILMTHHHLIEDQFDLPAAKNAGRLANLLKHYNVAAILNGHTHHFFNSFFAGIPCLTADSVSFRGENLPDGRVEFYDHFGMNWCEWDCEIGFSCRRITDNRYSKKLDSVIF